MELEQKCVYFSEDEALKAYMKFNGRWYAGKQLSCQLCVVEKWKSAICGEFELQALPGFLSHFTILSSDRYNLNRMIKSIKSKLKQGIKFFIIDRTKRKKKNCLQ